MNAKSEIIFDSYTDFTHLYPEFITIFSGNRAFELSPDSDEYAGKSYFFKVILREEGSNAIGNQYTFQVSVEASGDSSTNTNNGGNNQAPINPDDEGGNGNENNGGSDSSSGTEDSSTEPTDQQSGNGSNKNLVKQTGRSRTGLVVATDTFE